MQFLLLSFLPGFVAALPCHKLPQSQVALRIVNPAPAYRTPSGDIQHTLKQSDDTIRLAVGQTLSLEHAPLHIQAISIAKITTGKDLSPRPRVVAQDDWRVVCKAKIGYGSKGWVFGVEDGVVVLNPKGEAADVTGLECWLEGDGGLIGGF